MFTVAVGHSIDPDSQEAVAEVLLQCQDTLAGTTPQAGILFAAIDFDHPAILSAIVAVFPDLELVGCTADGELSSELGFQQDSLTLMLFASDEVEICATVHRHLSQTSPAEIQATVQAATAQLAVAPRLCLAFPDGLHTNASALVESLQAALGPVPLFGGVAAERPRAQQTFQFFRDEVLEDSMPLLLLGGNLLLSHSFASGWRPIGKRGQVTEVEGNLIKTIDHRPALEFYQHYFDDYSADAAYPLAVFAPGEENFFLRGSVTYNPEDGSLVMGGNVPPGSWVQITEADREDIIQASKASLDQALQSYPGQQPRVALYFSCAWRRWVLGTYTEREFEAVRQRLVTKETGANDAPSLLPCCGFYTFGEIAPLREYGSALAHNTTFVTLLLGTH